MSYQNLSQIVSLILLFNDDHAWKFKDQRHFVVQSSHFLKLPRHEEMKDEYGLGFAVLSCLWLLAVPAGPYEGPGMLRTLDTGTNLPLPLVLLVIN